VSDHFDLVVLGAGPGGYVAAIRGAQLGMSVAVVEERYWGGVCLNVGCIPSKALLRNAELVHIFHHEAKTFGISGDVSFDFGVAHKRSRTVADGRVKGVHYLMKKNKITEIDGRGTFTDANTIRVGDRTVTFDHCIIAAGAGTRLLPGTTLSERVVTYEEQILDDTLPESIIIVGAGAIGVEFAYVLHNYGVKVTIVEFLDRMLPLEDAEVSAELRRQYRRLGVDVLVGTKVEKIEDAGEQVTVTVSSGDKRSTLTAAKVLQAIGFKANVEGYGLESTGVRLTQAGAIDIDDHCRTSVPHIYAIGDVTAKLMLAHAAEAMGIVAAETIAGAETMPLDYTMIPRATYCQPQVASFGWTEAQARDKGFDVKVAKFPFTANGKAHGLGDATGFVKIISDAKYGELLGAHLIGENVTELLAELVLAQRLEATEAEIIETMHPHPTLSEAVMEAAGVADNRAIHL
jgi:dihydrolipoamide dehydrogenase